MRAIGKTGIFEVITSFFPDKMRKAPNKSPYIQLIVPTNSVPEYFADLENFGLWVKESYLTKNYEHREEYVFTITSARKVLQTIDVLLSNLTENDNKELIARLNDYKKYCESIQATKKKTVPLKSKLSSDFKRVNTKVRKSNNSTQVIQSIQNPNDQYVLKLNHWERSISDIEAFNAFSFQLLLNDRHPEVIGIHDSRQERVGVASKMISGFKSVADFIHEKNRKLTKQEMLDSEMVKVWVSSYFGEETDLHLNNYGFNKDGFAVKIDDDRASWPLTSKYLNVNPETGGGKHYTTPPVSDFPITRQGIKEFPLLPYNANPYYWHENAPLVESFSRNELDELYKDPKFITDKYHMFLKSALIPRQAYEGAALATAFSEHTRKKLVDHKCRRTELLKKELIHVDEFQEYLNSNPHALDQILKEFTEYNNKFQKEVDKALRIDLNEVTKTFDELKQMAKEVEVKRKEEEKRKEAEFWKSREIIPTDAELEAAFWIAHETSIFDQDCNEVFKIAEEIYSWEKREIPSIPDQEFNELKENAEKHEKIDRLIEEIIVVQPLQNEAPKMFNIDAEALFKKISDLIKNIEKNSRNKRDTTSWLFRHHFKNSFLAEKRNKVADCLCSQLKKQLDTCSSGNGHNPENSQNQLNILLQNSKNLLKQAKIVNQQVSFLCARPRDGKSSLDVCIDDGLHKLESLSIKLKMK